MNTKSELSFSTESRLPTAWRVSLRTGIILSAATLFFAAAVPALAQTPFTPGDLVISTYGEEGGYMNGTLMGTSVDGVPTPISLEEFTTSGTFVMTNTLPTIDSGSNFGIVGEYGSSSEANLQLSGDGQSLLIAGYQADASIAGTGSPGGLGYYNGNPDGVDALAQSTDTAVPRLVADIGANGVANVSTQFNDLYSTNNPRSVWSASGSTYYLSGQGGGSNDQGIFTIPAGTNTVTGGTTPTPISSNTGLSTRVVSAFSGNLYYSVDVKNAATGIYEYSGIPTSVATATQITPANNGLSGSNEVFYSPDGFYFANSTVLYVADTGDPKNKGLSDGGIQKWTLSGGTWHLAYTLTSSNFVPNFNDKTSSLNDGEVGFESVTGKVVNGTVDLFAISYTIGDADQDGLYAITDNLTATTDVGDSVVELATAPGIGDVTSFTAPGGAVFKSVSFAPVPEPATTGVLAGVFVLVAALVHRRLRTRTQVASFITGTILLAVAGSPSQVRAATGSSVSYTGVTYIQNFDSLPFTSGTSVNTNNPVTINSTKYTFTGVSTPATFDFGAAIDTSGTTSGSTGGLGLSATMPGWYGAANAGIKFGASAGDQSTGGDISFGALTSSNRALGLIASSSTGLTTFGVKLINNTGAAISTINLSFTGELWRQQTAQQTIDYSYLVDSNLSDAMPLTGTTQLGTFNYATGTSSGSTANSAPVNSSSITDNSQVISSWAAGSALWITWQTAATVSGGQGLGIDNFSFSTPAVAVPEPGLTAVIFGIGSCVLALAQTRRKK